MVRTTRFTILTWIPLSLYWQLHRLANVYFLVVACLAVLYKHSEFTIIVSKVVPFVMVLLWTAGKDLYEDQRRRMDDDKENSRTCMRFNLQTKALESTKWRDVLVGDLLVSFNDDAFPADLILLQAAGGHESFISTVNLDGETNLKERRAPAALHDHLRKLAEEKESHSEGSSFLREGRSSLVTLVDETSYMEEAKQALEMLLDSGLSVKMSAPEVGLADVRGNVEAGWAQAAVSEISFLPRGCVLKNTIWAISVVAYVGNDTKTRLNAGVTVKKSTSMQSTLNVQVRTVVIVIVVVCACCAIASVSLHGRNLCPQCWDWPDALFWSWVAHLVSVSYIVPISLYVCFEMLKLGLGFALNSDPQMVDPATQQSALARTTDLMEEMGQVDFLFSDKTGTLTANEMVFARCYIPGAGDLGDFRASSPGREGLKMAKSIVSSGMETDERHKPVSLFFTCLAVCHAVQAESTIEDMDAGGKSFHGGDIIYSGMSPDEVALVEAAAETNVVFKKRTRAKRSTASAILTVSRGQETLTFEVLHEIEFNSDRKRMSIIARCGEEIWCVTKGADSIMQDLLREPLHALAYEAVDNFAKIGLRTLLVGMRKLTEEELAKWQADMNECAQILDSSRAAKVDEVSARIETNLEFVGVTAVEDRLQDGVPECIQTIKRAGIRMWVLTGDKIETAVDIARSCGLFGDMSTLAFAVDASSHAEAEQTLTKARGDLQDCADGGLVLDGRTLKFALADERLRALVHDLGMASRACICCRLTPLQKRRLVELVRAARPQTITIAIGDGANDVPMIEGAHVGVGIRGKEGNQAVQACDIAISQFRFLTPLLLCHGRRAYQRASVFLCYFFYKSIVLAAGEIIWAFQCSFTAKLAFPALLNMGFNVIYTSWNVVVMLSVDQDVADSVAVVNPQLYHVGPRQDLLNIWVFGRWMLLALWHGTVAWLIPNLWVGGDAGWSEKTYTKFWLGSCTSFTAAVVIVNLRMVLIAQNPLSAWTLVPVVVAIALLFGWLYMMSATTMDPVAAGIMPAMFTDCKPVAAIVVCTCVALSVDILFKTLRYTLFPSELQQLRKTTGRGHPGQAVTRGLRSQRTVVAVPMRRSTTTSVPPV